MKISEIFYSIEGEGKEIGKPEVFVRLPDVTSDVDGVIQNMHWKVEKSAVTKK